MTLPTPRKLTPVLCVDSIEECLSFWQRMGFTTTMSLPHEDRLGFAILDGSGIELMLQSRASVAADAPALARGPFASDGVILFLEVADLAPVLAATRREEIVVPERTTFYGMREIGLRAPGGFLVVFAQPVSAA